MTTPSNPSVRPGSRPARPLREIPFLGAGIGFRREMKADTLENLARIDFLEIISEQYMDMPPHKDAEARDLASRVPIVMHGVELSIGTYGPLDELHVAKMQRVAELSRARWVSDHLCMTRVDERAIGNLTPISFTADNCENVIGKARALASRFDRPFLLENISYYFHVPPRELSEAEFITRVVEGADCYLLLDLANVHNNAVNNGYDACELVDALPLERVVQIHLAGGYYHGDVLLDTHSHAVPEEVLDLLAYSIDRMPNLRGVLIERDQSFPPIEELLGELDRVRALILERWAPRHAAGLPGPEWLSGRAAAATH